METHRTGMVARIGRAQSRWNKFCLIAMTGFLLYVAPQALANEPFEFGWWDSFGQTGSAGAIALEGASIALTYNYNVPSATIQTWLDSAYASGLKVIAGIPNQAIWDQDVVAIQSFVQQFDTHPAVVGWYTLDEPHPGAHPYTKTAYDSIKQVSTKPVSIVFAYTAAVEALADSCDTILFANYPCHVGNDEFEGSLWDDFRTEIADAGSLAKELGKSYMPVHQGFGRQGDITSQRFPTFREARYMTYYGIDNNATGTLFWVYYRAIRGAGMPGDPYPYSGFAWNEDVFKPLANEMDTIGSAIVAGELDNAASSNTPDVHTQVYQDPDTLKYYLVAMNSVDGSESTTFSINLPGWNWISAIPLFEGAQAEIPIIDGQFSALFSDYQVHVYELQHAPEPVTMVMFGVGSLLLIRRKNALLRG